MNQIRIKTDEAARFIRSRWPDCDARIAVVLGSGLGGFAESLENVRSLDAAEVPGWPSSTVEGHTGRIHLGRIEGRPVIVLQGRVHYYEGFPVDQVVFPVRVLGRLGVTVLILTNAAGGIRPDLRPGGFMVITDHINCMGVNPLIGPNDPEFGPRFPDLSAAYDPGLIETASACAAELGIRLARGVLAATSGPSYETAAEVRMLRTCGADAVCMSTVPETIAANHMGMAVLGISCISNPAAGLGGGPLSHDEVRRNADAGRERFSKLIRAVIRRTDA
ncbi:purine-nucleoside phosphorylase [bacterium]|nr:purine-nucleoside phosphorylase [bacterium]